MVSVIAVHIHYIGVHHNPEFMYTNGKFFHKIHENNFLKFSAEFTLSLGYLEINPQRKDVYMWVVKTVDVKLGRVLYRYKDEYAATEEELRKKIKSKGEKIISVEKNDEELKEGMPTMEVGINLG